MTSTPALHYWAAASLQVMSAVRSWRRDGLPVCSTVDAGSNVHVICPEMHRQEIASRLRSIPGVKDVLTTGVGGPAELMEDSPPK
jgi:diphosphomevalonate decarboxylase